MSVLPGGELFFELANQRRRQYGGEGFFYRCQTSSHFGGGGSVGCFSRVQVITRGVPRGRRA